MQQRTQGRLNFERWTVCEWMKLRWTISESTVLNINEGTRWSNAGSSTVFAQLLRKVDTGVNIERLNWYWTFRKYRRFIQIIIQRRDGTPRVGGTDKIIIAFAVYRVLTKSTIYQWGDVRFEPKKTQQEFAALCCRLPCSTCDNCYVIVARKLINLFFFFINFSIRFSS